MKVLVCGGRTYAKAEKVYHQLNIIHENSPISEIIEGGANGADRLARDWAQAHKIPVRTFEAQWATNGDKAGPMRNRAMLVEGQPSLVVAFPGGKGTTNMIGQARKANVPVISVPEF